MQHCARTLIALISSVLMSGAASAEPFDLAWTESAWAERDAFEIPAPLSAVWTVESDPGGTPEDLARLRAIVGDKPDHPQRSEMERLERKLAEGGTVTTYEICYRGERAFRISTTYPASDLLGYNDTVVKPDGSVWRMTDRGFFLFDLDRTPDGENPFMRTNSLKNFLRYSMWGGMGSGPLGRYPERATREGDTWRCEVAAAEDDRRWVITGDIVRDRDGKETLQPRETRVVAGEERWVGAEIRFADYRFVGELGREVAHRIEWVNADGSFRQIVRFESFGTCTADRFAELSVEPVPGVTDPVRGETVYTSVYDSRGGGTVIAGLDGVPLELPDTSQKRSAGGRWIYLVAGGLVALAVLVAVRMRTAQA